MYYELEVKEEREMSSTKIFGDRREGENTSTWDLKTSAQIAGPRECFATALCWGGLEGLQVFWKFTNLQEQFLLEISQVKQYFSLAASRQETSPQIRDQERHKHRKLCLGLSLSLACLFLGIKKHFSKLIQIFYNILLCNHFMTFEFHAVWGSKFIWVVVLHSQEKRQLSNVHLRLDTLCGFCKTIFHAKQRHIFWLSYFSKIYAGKSHCVQEINITLPTAWIMERWATLIWQLFCQIKVVTSVLWQPSQWWLVFC